MNREVANHPLPHGTSLRVLYISYDGLLEPLGQSQILPYLERLSAQRIEFFLLTFEKGTGRAARSESVELRRRLRDSGISWTSLRYHKFPAVPATLYDIFVGVVVGAVIARRHRVQIVHARSYVSALIAVILKQVFGVCFLFDMRGFWADERAEAGIWKHAGNLYRAAKAFERVYLKSADGVVSLTNAARVEIEAFDYLKGRRPSITVIPTCVDLEAFRIRTLHSARVVNPCRMGRFTLVYSGSLGTWYLLDEMLGFFVALKQRIPGALFLILTHSPRNLVETLARKYGLEERDLSVRGVPFLQVPEWIATGVAGVFFSAPSWANKARCPTKLAEFLAVGIPVVINRGIGDTEAIIREERVGVVAEEFSTTAYEKAVVQLLDLLSVEDLQGRCRHVAERYFSVEQGACKYRQVYQKLTGGT